MKKGINIKGNVSDGGGGCGGGVAVVVAVVAVVVVMRTLCVGSVNDRAACIGTAFRRLRLIRDEF